MHHLAGHSTWRRPVIAASNDPREYASKRLLGEKKKWDRAQDNERELARMCVWSDARDEKCLTPGESDVPVRMSWETWRLADETVAVPVWGSSDYPLAQLCHFSFKEYVLLALSANINNPWTSCITRLRGRTVIIEQNITSSWQDDVLYIRMITYQTIHYCPFFKYSQHCPE